MLKLNLDRDQLDECYQLAEDIVAKACRYLDYHSSLGIEQTTLRLLGVHGDENGIPLAQLLVESMEKTKLNQGVSSWFSRALLAHPDLSATDLARKIVRKEAVWQQMTETSWDQVHAHTKKLATAALKKLQEQNQKTEKGRKKHLKQNAAQPLFAIKLETGLFEQEEKNDFLSVLNDWGIDLFWTTDEKIPASSDEHFAGLKKTFHQITETTNKPTHWASHASGLDFVDRATIALQTGVDFLASDWIFESLEEAIHPKRSWMEHFFVRRLAAETKTSWISGDPIREMPSRFTKEASLFFVSQLLQAVFSKKAGIHESKLVFHHPFIPDSESIRENPILWELARLMLLKELFPQSLFGLEIRTPASLSLLHQPAYQTLPAWIGSLAGQNIFVLSFLKDDPKAFWMDRLLWIKQTLACFRHQKEIEPEIHFQNNGKVIRFSRQILETSIRFLKRISEIGLVQTVERGLFGPRPEGGFKGQERIFQKDRHYSNPFLPQKESSREANPREARKEKSESDKKS